MRHNPAHATTDPAAVRDLIRASPWATIVSDNGGELVASHDPFLRLVERFERACKRQLSQDKDDRSRRQVIAKLREPGPYRHPELLAAEMQCEWDAEA